MKVKMALRDLLFALNVVAPTIGAENSGHEGIHIYANKSKNRIKFTSTEGTAHTEIWVDGTVTEKGEAVVKADRFMKYVAKLDVKDVVLELKDDVLHFVSSRGKQQFATYESVTFPELPKTTAELSFDLSGKTYKELVGGVAFAAKKEDPKAAPNKLEGINVKCDGETLSLVATDGNSVATYTKRVKAPEMNVILTKRSLTNSIKFVDDDEKVTIQYCGGLCLIKCKSISFYVPVIADKYPDLSRIIPGKKFEASFTADRKEFMGLLERASILIESSGVIKGTIQMEEGKVTLTGKAQGYNFNETLETKVRLKNPDCANVTIDIKRLIDIIKNVDSDVIKIGVIEKQPIAIRPNGREDHTCLLAVG